LMTWAVLELIMLSSGMTNIIIPIALAGTVIGHCYPVWNKFIGGKGVATGFGALLCINWIVGLIAIVIWIILVKTIKYVSLSSLIAAWIAAGLMFIPAMQHLPVVPDFSALVDWWAISIFVVIIVGVITLRHKSNIINLINGDELKGAPKENASPKNKEKKEVK
jgi:glycerol-3-phosphate acyltransferase PlsY